MKVNAFLRTYMYLISGCLQNPPPPAFEYFVTSFTVAHGRVETPQSTIVLLLKTPLYIICNSLSLVFLTPPPPPYPLIFSPFYVSLPAPPPPPLHFVSPSSVSHLLTPTINLGLNYLFICLHLNC